MKIDELREIFLFIFLLLSLSIIKIYWHTQRTFFSFSRFFRWKFAATFFVMKIEVNRIHGVGERAGWMRKENKNKKGKRTFQWIFFYFFFAGVFFGPFRISKEFSSHCFFMSQIFALFLLSIVERLGQQRQEVIEEKLRDSKSY